MQTIILFIAVMLVAAMAFRPMPSRVQSGSKLFALENSYGEKYRDKNGKMPGESGYVRPDIPVPENWAEYQKYLKEKKAVDEAEKAK